MKKPPCFPFAATRANTAGGGLKSTLAPASVDIAFVDTIHTGAFVDRQYALLKPLMRRGGLVLFDDIGFSDDMQACWQRVANEPGLAASATLGSQVGVAELT